ncbi:MAG TPA: AMP-binding protein, partial [Methylomirabilota bacterium]|nr:AMP-binding protein [Methylomirabilota bacterium]
PSGDASPEDLASLADLESAPADEPPGAVSERDLFYLGYTSGTTGRPKGAMVTHRNRALAYHYWALEYGIGEHDVALHAGPFHHTAPFGFTLTQLWMGGQVVILPSFDPLEALRSMAAASVTWSFMVPYMLNAVLHLPAEQHRSHRPRALRFLISAASPLPTATKEGLLARFPEVGLHEFYGATEAGVVTNLRPEDQRRKVRCVGKPILDTEVKVVGPTGEKVKPGEIGELYIKGPTLFDGYFNAPEMTAAAIRDGWSTLGDLAYLDEEGYVYIVDRVKDVIKSGGVNIFPTEIEEALTSHPAVYEAAVVGVPDERWGEAARAIVVLRSGAAADAAAILAHCRGLLADYKIPKAVEFRDSLPRNPAGKVLKRVLRDEFWGGRRVRV